MASPPSSPSPAEPALADRLDALAVKFSTKLHEANRSDVARVPPNWDSSVAPFGRRARTTR